MAPATAPIAMDSIGSTKPDAGVMATRPATQPAAAPTTEGLPLMSQLMTTQDSAAVEAAVEVTRNAFTAAGGAAQDRHAVAATSVLVDLLHKLAAGPEHAGGPWPFPETNKLPRGLLSREQQGLVDGQWLGRGAHDEAAAAGTAA